MAFIGFLLPRARERDRFIRAKRRDEQLRRRAAADRTAAAAERRRARDAEEALARAQWRAEAIVRVIYFRMNKIVFL